MAATAAAAIGIATPAWADTNCPTCTVTVDATGTPLDYPIYGDPVKATNGTLNTVYGSAPNNNGADNVTFTGNTALWISQGFAQVQDGGTQGDLNNIIINPDDDFNLFEFATQLEGTSGWVYVYYLLTGSGLDANAFSSYNPATCGTYCGLAGYYLSGSNDNANYLLGGANFDGFMVVTADTSFSLFQSKQLSYNLAGVTPPVPEPATWALMLLGFGGIGMALRRSRRRGKQALMQVA
jgi:hypothetical protein